MGSLGGGSCVAFGATERDRPDVLALLRVALDAVSVSSFSFSWHLGAYLAVGVVLFGGGVCSLHSRLPSYWVCGHALVFSSLSPGILQYSTL